MGEAIKTVQELYSGLLENNQNLLFMLKVRFSIILISFNPLVFTLYILCYLNFRVKFFLDSNSPRKFKVK